MLVSIPAENATPAERVSWLESCIRSERPASGEMTKADFSLLALSYREGWESVVRLVVATGERRPDNTELLLATVNMLLNIGKEITAAHGGMEYILSLLDHPDPGVRDAASRLRRLEAL